MGPIKNTKLQRNKSSTQLRILGNLNKIFDAILEYLNKGISRLQFWNHRVRKKFQALKKKKKKFDQLDQKFSSSIKVLPLNTLAISFPTNFDDEYVSGFFDIFKVFENPLDEIRITKLYLNGSCIHPHNLRKLNWINIFQSQHIGKLY